jgi:hypothetical protein
MCDATQLVLEWMRPSYESPPLPKQKRSPGRDSWAGAFDPDQPSRHTDTGHSRPFTTVVVDEAFGIEFA